MSVVIPTYTEMVAVAWLKGVTGLSKSMVDVELPDDVNTWVNNGFVTVQTIAGVRNMYVPLNSPIVNVNCWATSSVETDPPWNVSHRLAELIDRGCRSRGSHRKVYMSGFTTALVHSVYLVNEPRRLYIGEGNYARVILDLALHWTDVS